MNYFKSVYFHIEPDVIYDDAVAYLAEGLHDLGIQCFGSRNYWWDKKTASPIVKKTNIEKQFWPIIFIDYLAYQYDFIDRSGKYHSRIKVPNIDLLRKNSEVLVLIDLADGYSDRGGDDPRIDLVFRAKFNKNCKQSEKTRPYILGVQKRVLENLPRKINSEKNKKIILDTFGFSHSYSHGSRSWFRYKIVPLLNNKGISVHRKMAGSLQRGPTQQKERRWWFLTRHLHNPEYYNLIKKFPMHASFCGELLPGLPKDPSAILKGGNKAKIQKKAYSILSKAMGLKRRLIQWDSWRFWETLSLGVAPLLYDLEKTGVLLPVMPINWVHYVGIDPDDPESSIEKLKNEWGRVPKIGCAGRAWLIKNYAPKENAKRVLSEVQRLKQ